MSADSEEAKALAAEEAAIEMFKIKKLIGSLERARGYVIHSGRSPFTSTEIVTFD